MKLVNQNVHYLHLFIGEKETKKRGVNRTEEKGEKEKAEWVRKISYNCSTINQSQKQYLWTVSLYSNIKIFAE